jgi:hypothetical protein
MPPVKVHTFRRTPVTCILHTERRDCVDNMKNKLLVLCQLLVSAMHQVLLLALGPGAAAVADAVEDEGLATNSGVNRAEPLLEV